MRSDDRAESEADAIRVLGSDFRLSGRTLVPGGYTEVLHSSGIAFAFVPGGQFEMGLSESDVDALRRAVPESARIEKMVAALAPRCRPVRTVRVEPLLVSVQTLSGELVKSLSGGNLGGDLQKRRDAKALAASHGFRIPSEAELEFLARSGRGDAFTADGARVYFETRDYPTVSPLGIVNLTLGEWAADDWHDTYDGAPTTAEAWMDGHARGVYRGALPLGIDAGPHELVFGLAAYRCDAPKPGEATDASYQCFRFARSIG